MYFEIQAQRNQVVETDNFHDVESISCIDNQIVYKNLTLGKYQTEKRAAKILEELLDTFRNGKSDFYKLPRR